MAYEIFVPKRFRAANMEIIRKAVIICDEYMAQGFTLTLRQLYYQFVARDWLPNKQTEYSRLGGIINDARLAGLIDWAALEDRTRNLEALPHWDSPKDIVKGCATQFRYDRWLTQEVRCEVWIEKEALVGVVEPTCEKWRVPYFACRGYTSQSEQYSAAKRFRSYSDEGKRVVIFHLGDHDPSGIDMTRDNTDRLRLFAQEDMFGDTVVEVRRLALNMKQIKRYRPPPNPAKMTDSRFAGYEQKFGKQSWELDALNPTIIAALVEDNIERLIDDHEWDESVKRENKARAQLLKVANNWKD